MNEILKRDQNFVTVLAGVTNDSDKDITMLRVDPISKRLLILASFSGGVVTTINGLSGAVTLAAGSNITITPSGNTLTFASSGGGGGSPGGSNGDIQYNNSGSFGGVTVVPVSNGGSGLTGVRTNIATTGNIADQAVASSWLNFTGGAQIILTGLVAQADGTEVTITNDNSTVGLFIANGNTSSLTANRIITPTAAGLTNVIYPNQSVTLRYDGNISRWRYVSTSIVSSGGGAGYVNFTDGFGNWINDAGDFIYESSNHRLELANIFVDSSTQLDGLTRFLGSTNWAFDGGALFTYTSGLGSGTITSDPFNFFWDNNNKRLGLGTDTPSYQLDVVGNVLTILPPTSFTITLQTEFFILPGSDTLSLLYGPTATTSASGTADVSETGFTGSIGGSLNYTIYSYSIINSVQYTSPDFISFSVTDPATPQDNGSDNGSVENPSYSGYTNNDTVQATIYSYRSIGGIQYLSPTGFALGPIILLNNPSGIDWSWNPTTNSDGSSPDGYWICIYDVTLNTNNCFDVGNVLTYADNNSSGAISPPTPIGIPFGVDLTWIPAYNGDGSGVGGYLIYNTSSGFSYDVGNVTSYTDTNINNTVSLNPFSGFTSSGQTFSFDLFAQGTSPTGGIYYNDNGNGYNISITDMLNNGSMFWISHNITSTGGNPWREAESDASSAGYTFDGTGDQQFYQTTGYTGSLVTTPNHYGIQSDGSTLTRDYEAFSYNTSPGTYYSATSYNASTVDPNDGQYYYFQYDFTDSYEGIRTLEQINSGGFNDSRDQLSINGTFYQDGLGGGFVGPTTVTPSSFPEPSGRFQNALLLAPTSLLSPLVDGAMEYDGTHLYFTIGATRHTII